MSKRTPSAWELVHGEPEHVSYWKYRTRRAETLYPFMFAGGWAVGWIVIAALRAWVVCVQ